MINNNKYWFVRTRSARRLTRFGLALAALLMSCTHSFSEAGCEYPNLFGPSFAPEANHAGEFHVVLQPPDYQNSVLVQKHFVFSSVWGGAIRASLIKQTNSRCDAIFAKESFPNLRAFLIDRHPETGSRKAGVLPCEDALRNVLNVSPDKDEIIRSSSMEEETRKLLQPRAGRINISDLVNDALREIYYPGTFMRALLSVEPSLFGSMKIDEFFAWLKQQQAGHAVELRRLQFCEPGYEFGADTARVASLPSSSVMPAGTLALPLRSEIPLAPSLRRFVIVGAGRVLAYGPSRPKALEKYCDQVIALNSKGNREGVSSARVKCWRNMFFSESWTVFYCDPADCTSEEITEIVTSQIANDNSLLLIGGQKTRGPYVVAVQSEASR